MSFVENKSNTYIYKQQDTKDTDANPIKKIINLLSSTRHKGDHRKTF